MGFNLIEENSFYIKDKSMYICVKPKTVVKITTLTINLPDIQQILKEIEYRFGYIKGKNYSESGCLHSKLVYI